MALVAGLGGWVRGTGVDSTFWLFHALPTLPRLVRVACRLVPGDVLEAAVRLCSPSVACQVADRGAGVSTRVGRRHGLSSR